MDGKDVGWGALPKLESGIWSAAWVGNTATNGLASFNGEIHDVVVRNSATSSAVVSQLMVTPDVIDPTGIVLRLQGDPATLTVVNRSATTVTVASAGSALVDASAAPAVPLWTYGSTQGTYRETISGLRKQAITVSGAFQLTRINQDPNLR